MPFEIRLYDGQRFRFKSVEQLLVGRNPLVTTDRRGEIQFVSIGLISTIGPWSSGGKRRSRRA